MPQRRIKITIVTSLSVIFGAWSLRGLLAEGAPAPRRPVQAPPKEVKRVPSPAQGVPGPLGPQLVQVDTVIRATEARQAFGVTGRGLTAAVLDTGLRATHRDFQGVPARVVAARNFTDEDGGDPDNVTDAHGHGSNVCGIVAANGVNLGIAPGANIIPLKVLDDDGGSFEDIAAALDWVLENRDRFNITVVNMSIGDSGNHGDEDPFPSDELRLRVRRLREARVAVVVSAGNDFAAHDSQQGMSYPAIFPEAVSVGAVYDANIGGPISYSGGAVANSTDVDRITPFSQRLFREDDPPTGPTTGTDLFAPGAAVRSTGILADNGFSIAMHGTSQAAPATAGLILLMQEYHRNLTRTSPADPGELPTVDDIEIWLRRSGTPIVDGDDEDDNVVNTGKSFRRIDAVGALNAITLQLQNDLVTQEPQRVEAVSKALKLQTLRPGGPETRGGGRRRPE